MQAVIRLLVILAIIARGIIPVGFMPAHASNGDLELVICTGHGVEVLPSGEPAQPGPKSSDKDGVCPFAASAPIAIAAAFAEPLVVSWAWLDRISPLADRHLASRVVRTARARAPPLRQL
jgi:Protein of unknown function (DUF2946)